MANTQGMSDEGMASLLTPSPLVSGGDKKQKRGPSAFKKQRAALERRMMQEPGDRPAATVLRASPRTSTPAAKPVTIDDSKPAKESQVSETKPPVMGSIVERPVHQQTRQRRRQSPRMISPLGSPSVHVPLGTFVKTSQKKKQQDQDRMEKSTNKGTGTSPLIASTSNSKPDVMEASDRDADNMLAQMSIEEIRESVEELHAALSPETIAFLKQRKSQTKKTSDTRNSAIDNQQQKERQLKESSPAHHQSPTLVGKSTVEEKELSSQALPTLPESAVSPNENENITVDEADDDFHQACVLLRSTSLQQVQWAARTVCHCLVEQQQRSIADRKEEIFDYPVLLPVSLRCVLDETPASSGGILLLHSYILRSLYALLCISAPLDHVVDVTKPNQSSTIIYQERFMDDSVLTPPLDQRYGNTNAGQPLKMGTETVAYSTSSSTTSAQADGEAFRKDPMWTLLSRMRILPRLAQLLSYNLPDEALVAIFGILTMLAVRSPGAAAAIAQHAALLPRLLQKIGLLPPTDDEENSNGSGTASATLGFPALMLLNTLARQSRIVAESLPFDFIVPNILGQTAVSQQELHVQRHAIILWRTMLRYRLGLSHVPTFVTLAIPHLASALLNSNGTKKPQDALATEYLTAFALVCEHAAFLRSHPELNTATESKSSGDGNTLVDTAWLASLVRQCNQHLEAIRGSPSQDAKSFNGDDARLHTACMRLVCSSLILDSVAAKSNEKYPDTEEESCKVADVDHCSKALRAVWESGMVQSAFELVSPCIANLNVSNSVPLEGEAAACALLEAFALLLSELVQACSHRPDNNAQQDLITRLTNECRKLFLKVVITEKDGLDVDGAMPPNAVPVARLGWLNTAHFQICRFLAETSHQTELQVVLQQMRSSVFTLLARLQHGQEAMADYLFQQDVLFRPVSMSSLREGARSPLATMLLRELYSIDQSRIQLNHSFKLLRHSLGAGQGGPLELDTLLSTADSQRLNQPMNSSELLLPLGALWLWHVLSGAVVPPPAMDDKDEESLWAEVSNIVSTCLSIMLELEQGGSSYAMQVSNGSKLYHLFNVCLYPENVIRNEKVGELVIGLFDEYTRKSNGAYMESSFLETCFRHSQTSQGRKGSQKEPDTDDEELKKIALGGSSSLEIVALENFAGDLCDAYVEYGAQYDAFTKCVRFLLRPGFPAKVRCETIHRLRQALHLLTLPSEEEDPAGPAMIALLESSLVGGLPDRDGSSRDAPQVLDIVASVLKESGDCDSRWIAAQESYFALFAVAVLARSLAASVSSGASSLEASKRRMKDIPRMVLELIVNTASRLLASPKGNKRDLVHCALDICVKKTKDKEMIKLVQDNAWEQGARLLIHQVEG